MPKRPATYSKADLARHFRMPESTVRFYCSRFAPFLPGVGQGRSRRYEAACLGVFDFIRDNFPKLRTARAMDEALARKFGRMASFAPAIAADRGDSRNDAEIWPESTIPGQFAQLLPPGRPAQGSAPAVAVESGVPGAPDRALHLLERQSAALERIADSLDRLAAREREPGGAFPSTPDVDALRAELTEEVRRLRGLLSTAETVREEDMAQLRGWLLRLANK